jgi:hypothetical protein
MKLKVHCIGVLFIAYISRMADLELGYRRLRSR